MVPKGLKRKMSELHWSQYQINLITEYPDSILYEFGRRGFFSSFPVKSFEYNPDKDYFSNDMEKSFIGCLHRNNDFPNFNSYTINYISEKYFNEIENNLSKLELPIDEIINLYNNCNCIFNENEVILKRGVIFKKIHKNICIKVIEGSDIYQYEFCFYGNIKLCRLNLVKVFDLKLGWIPYNEIEEENNNNSLSALKITIQLLVIENKRLKDNIKRIEERIK